MEELLIGEQKHLSKHHHLEASIAQAQKYIRSVTMYDQLTTRARFDVLWLSDDVRVNYTNLYALKFGKTEEQKRSFLTTTAGRK